MLQGRVVDGAVLLEFRVVRRRRLVVEFRAVLDNVAIGRWCEYQAQTM